MSSRDISDYPAFHELADVNSFVSMAKSMITDGNRLRKQVDKIVVDKMATGGGGGGGGSKTPSQGKNKRNKIVISPTSSEESSDSPPPTSKTTSKRKKNKKKKPKTPAAAAASTRPGNGRGNRTVGRRAASPSTRTTPSAATDRRPKVTAPAPTAPARTKMPSDQRRPPRPPRRLHSRTQGFSLWTRSVPCLLRHLPTPKCVVLLLPTPKCVVLLRHRVRWLLLTG